ncbi:MAG: CRTAC1 family protein [Planctomycetes bacterium]|nr:CRTAC1 family protein [Planctomycetota bacterium]
MSLRPPRVSLLLALLAASPAAQTTFVDVAHAAGVDFLNLGRGAAMIDLDGDGRLDLVCGSGYGGTMPGDEKVYRQKADHTFDDVTAAWGFLPNSEDAFSVLATDLDDDGDVDVYFANGGFAANQANQLLRNDLDTLGSFTDVSATAGDADLTDIAFGTTALDADLDGDLDLFVSDNGSGATPGGVHLLRNDGALQFTEVTVAAGMDATGWFRHCGAGDYDNDGWPDVGAGNYTGANVLYHNDADGTFTNVAAKAGVLSPDQNYGFVFADFDNDGWLDVFLPKWQPQVSAVPTTFLLNAGDGTFTDVTDGMETGFHTDMGHNVADVDADGYPDVFIGTGWPYGAYKDILFLVRPDGLGGLIATDASAASGIEAVGETRCHGVAFGDYDEDGDVDIYLNLGGMSHAPDTAQANVLWQNQGNGNHWLQLDPRGVLSSRTPAGLHGELVVPGRDPVQRTLMVGSGFGNTDAPALHFGTGDASGPAEVRLRWPSGIVQTLLLPGIDTRHTVVETGLRLLGQVELGGLVTLQACGPAGQIAELMIGTQAAHLPLPKFGGYLELLPPLVGPLPVPLGPAGLLELPVPLPDDPALSGATISLQAWTHDPGGIAGSGLSNRIDLVFP